MNARAKELNNFEFNCASRVIRTHDGEVVHAGVDQKIQNDAVLIRKIWKINASLGFQLVS